MVGPSLLAEQKGKQEREARSPGPFLTTYCARWWSQCWAQWYLSLAALDGMALSIQALSVRCVGWSEHPILLTGCGCLGASLLHPRPQVPRLDKV